MSEGADKSIVVENDKEGVQHSGNIIVAALDRPICNNREVEWGENS